MVLAVSKAIDLVIVGGLGLLIFDLYVGRNDLGDWRLYLLSMVTGLLLASIVFRVFDVYDEREIAIGQDSIRRLLSAWCVSVGLFLLIAFGLKISDQFSRIWFVSWVLSSAVGITAHRLMLRHLVHRWAEGGMLAAHTVIVGAGSQGARLAHYLRENEDVRTQIVGFVDDEADSVPEAVEGFRFLGDTDLLERMVRDGEVDEVIIALPWSADDRVRRLTHRLAQFPVQIRLAPDLAGFNFTQTRFSFLAGLPMLNVFERPMSGWSSVVKAIEDRVLAGLLVAALAPVLLLIAAAIKLDSRGPVLFRQKRPGFNQRLIQVYKFRTMHETRCDAGGSVQAKRDDPRITRVGQFLRKTSLDELPQLLNVLKGEMSIVGPRPHPLGMTSAGRKLEEVVDDYAARHNVKPGMTGWAQVNGWRGETDTAEKLRKRVEHDLYYIENWSLWFDCRILLRTIFIVLHDDNAY